MVVLGVLVRASGYASYRRLSGDAFSDIAPALAVIAALTIAMLIVVIFMGEAGPSAKSMSLMGLAIGPGMMVGEI